MKTLTPEQIERELDLTDEHVAAAMRTDSVAWDTCLCATCIKTGARSCQKLVSMTTDEQGGARPRFEKCEVEETNMTQRHDIIDENEQNIAHASQREHEAKMAAMGRAVRRPMRTDAQGKRDPAADHRARMATISRTGRDPGPPEAA